MEILEILRNRLIESKAKKEMLEVQIKELEERYETAFSSLSVLEEVENLLILTSDEVRKTSIETLEKTVTSMLQAIINKDYSFFIKQSVKRNKPSVDFFIVTTVDGKRSEQSVVDFSAGGFVDIISTALRYAYMSLLDGGLNGPMLLDETGRMLSQESTEVYTQFLKYLSDTFGRQTILVTHAEKVSNYADKNIIVVKNKDKSQILESR